MRLRIPRVITPNRKVPTALRYVGWDPRFFRSQSLRNRYRRDTVTTIFALFRDNATTLARRALLSARGIDRFPLASLRDAQ